LIYSSFYLKTTIIGIVETRSRISINVSSWVKEIDRFLKNAIEKHLRDK
jgi:hypothetical protein